MKLLKEFVDECSKKLNLKSIIQFGSSTYSKNFDDIDLLFFFDDLVMSYEDSLKLPEIINDFEKKYKNVSFDFGGVSTSEKKINISVILYQEAYVKWGVGSYLIKSFIEDKDKKILYGEDPFPKDYVVEKRSLVERFALELNFYYRLILNQDKKDDPIYHFFKIFMRFMLLDEGSFRKSDLIKEFKRKYGDKINLPKNSGEILNKKIAKEDYFDVLRFGKDCLRFLAK